MQLLETIRFENGQFENLTYHQQRMNNARRELFGCGDEINLIDALQAWTHEAGFEEPDQVSMLDHSKKSLFSGFIGCRQAMAFRSANKQRSSGLHKCRIIYSSQIEIIELLPYQIPQIQSLKIVHNDSIDYAYKYLDRTELDNLHKKKDNCDDILIVKNGLITDTWFASILFFNGKDWITPARPLLDGTQRAKLLDKEIIRTADIRLADLKLFQRARLINAMIRFEDKIDIPINRILE